MEENSQRRNRIRDRANAIKPHRCRNLIAVLECPRDRVNIGTVIRNVNALGVEKVYVVDPRRTLPDDWEDMREARSLSSASASAVKWSFVKRFDSTEDCLAHLEKNNFASIVTSPHVKGRRNAILEDVDYTRYKKLAVWFGNESVGVSDEAIARSEMCISIPMFGMIESLNLGTTSGIVLHEIAKQRRNFWKTKSKEKPHGMESNSGLLRH